MITRAPRVPLTYSRADAADALGISLPAFDRLVSASQLTPRFIGSKPVFTAAELTAYVESLPYEKPTRDT
jgi:hypothetical protein